MPRAPDGEYELVLENRQVLIVFFAAVVLCGVFFGLGYTVGKNTMGYIPPAAEATAVAAAGKKSATQPVGAAEAPKEALASAQPQAAAPPASNLTYDRALEGKNPPAGLQTRPATPPAPEAGPAPAASEVTVSLQVAALSKKEDAEALLGLLSKKGFRAYTVTNNADRLFRVQVGPFSSSKDVEEAKARLEQEGFKVITKK